jgi:hypothetical protein
VRENRGSHGGTANTAGEKPEERGLNTEDAEGTEVFWMKGERVIITL